MARKQVLGLDITLAHSISQLLKESVVADSEEEGENKSLLESAIDNNYHLSDQFIPPPQVLKLFADLKEVEDILRSPDTLLDNKTANYLEAHVSPAQNLK